VQVPTWPTAAPLDPTLTPSPHASIFDIFDYGKSVDDKCTLRTHDCPSRRHECAEAPPGCHYSKELEKLGNGMCCPKVCHLVCSRDDQQSQDFAALKGPERPSPGLRVPR
jgi:hypothetical protein